MKLSTLGIVFAGATALVLSAQPAQAASIVCPTAAGTGFSAPIWDNVSSNTGINGCELGGGNTDSVATVNADSMFNLTDWALLTGANVNAQPGGTGIISWNSSVYTGLTINSLMLVLKDGDTNTLPQNGTTCCVYVGYLLPIANPLLTSVTVTTPFLNASNPTAFKDVSHYNLYYSTSTSTSINQLGSVPEPTSLLLLGTGLVGAGVRRYRRRA